MEKKLDEFLDMVQEKLNRVKTLVSLGCYRDAEAESQELMLMATDLDNILDDIADVKDTLNELTIHI